MKLFMNKVYAMLLTIFIFPSVFAYNKIIYFISPPRSLSVAFMRMIQARGDFMIMHEPSQYAFNLINSPETVNEWFNENACKSFEEVKEKIFENAQKSQVFVKEISFAVESFLINDPTFIKDPNVHFVFLVRNPHHAVISFYKRIKQNFNIFDSPKARYDFSDVIGYKSLYEIVCAVKQHSRNEAPIILTEDIYNNPEDTIKYFCNVCTILFKEESLHWQDLGAEFSGQIEWNEMKKRDQTQHWHGEAIRSTSFCQPSTYEVDSFGEPTFSEIENLEHRKICIEAYKENLYYYNLILNLK